MRKFAPRGGGVPRFAEVFPVHRRCSLFCGSLPCADAAFLILRKPALHKGGVPHNKEAGFLLVVALPVKYVLDRLLEDVLPERDVAALARVWRKEKLRHSVRVDENRLHRVHAPAVFCAELRSVGIESFSESDGF